MTHPRTTALLVAAAASAGCIESGLYAYDGDDVFTQVEAGQVDVLLAVDNSCSMAPYQEELAENFEQFLTYFIQGDVQYQIGVVTSSVAPSEPIAQNGCTQADVNAIPAAGELVGGGWITPETPDAAGRFADAVRVGICGSGYEMGIESAYRAVSEPLASSVNSGFIRDDAYLSLIFVSDEQDASPRPVNEYINRFSQLKGLRNRDIFNASAIVMTDDGSCALNSGSTPGTRYVDVANQTGGVIGDICADDFGEIVIELSLASSRLNDTFYLSRTPDPGTLVVAVNNEEIACDSGIFSYQLEEIDGEPTGAIVFERTQMPPPAARITAKYKFGDGDPADWCTGEEDE